MRETFDDAEVRSLLVKVARDGRSLPYDEVLLTYGDVVFKLLHKTWNIKYRTPLISALNRIGEENQKKEPQKEPLLPALVVRKDRKRLPGHGFFRKFCDEKKKLCDKEMKSLHKKLVTKVQKFDWPD